MWNYQEYPHVSDYDHHTRVYVLFADVNDALPGAPTAIASRAVKLLEWYQTSLALIYNIYDSYTLQSLCLQSTLHVLNTSLTSTRSP